MNSFQKQFPTYIWCQFVPQSVITLNMLRQSRINSKLSAHDQVFGAFNYQRTPLAPLGTKVIIHKRPDQRKTWDKHGLPGFIVNREKYHFRSYQASVTKPEQQESRTQSNFSQRNTQCPRHRLTIILMQHLER